MLAQFLGPVRHRLALHLHRGRSPCEPRPVAHMRHCQPAAGWHRRLLLRDAHLRLHLRGEPQRTLRLPPGRLLVHRQRHAGSGLTQAHLRRRGHRPDDGPLAVLLLLSLAVDQQTTGFTSGSRRRRSSGSLVTTTARSRRARSATLASTTSAVPLRPHMTPTAWASSRSSTCTSSRPDPSKRARRACGCHGARLPSGASHAWIPTWTC